MESAPFSLPPRWYHDPEIYRRETDLVFYGSWRLVAHQSELAVAGDFVTADFCDESLVVLRDKEEKLRGFYNVCQHRGHRLVKPRRGRFERKMMVCPYHSWAFRLDGRLNGAPNSSKVVGFSKDRICLPAVKVESYGGFVWANTNLDAPGMNEFAPGLDAALRRYVPDLDEAVFFEGNFTHQPFNWKAMVDNSLDFYHVPYSGSVHRQLLACMEFEAFTRDVHENWVVTHAPPGVPNPGGYALDLSKSRGEADGANNIWVYPDNLISTLPVTRTFYMYNTPAFGPERTGINYTFYGHPTVRDLPVTRTAIEWINKQVGSEDNHQVMSVHLGTKSRGFKGTHFLIDGERSRLSEHPGAAFHRRIYEAVTGASS